MALADELLIDQITIEKFNEIAILYESILPQQIEDLDKLRYETIPSRVTESKEDGDAKLEKSDLLELVRWKLSKGKFRPSLQKLVQQNAEEFVLETTQAAYKERDHAVAIKKLSELRGVGPATASLALSVFNPENIPFFSDELFLWAMYESKSGIGWDRKIKYNFKEYAELLAKVNDLRTRFAEDGQTKITAVEVEKVAYVIAKEAGMDPPQTTGKRKIEDEDEKPVRKTKKTSKKQK